MRPTTSNFQVWAHFKLVECTMAPSRTIGGDYDMITGKNSVYCPLFIRRYDLDFDAANTGIQILIVAVNSSMGSNKGVACF